MSRASGTSEAKKRTLPPVSYLLPQPAHVRVRDARGEAGAWSEGRLGLFLLFLFLLFAAALLRRRRGVRRAPAPGGRGGVRVCAALVTAQDSADALQAT